MRYHTSALVSHPSPCLYSRDDEISSLALFSVVVGTSRQSHSIGPMYVFEAKLRSWAD